MRVQVGDVRLWFDVEGQGLVGEGPRMVARPTVVLVHGGPGADHSVFKPWLSPLADTAQLVYLDLPGSGRSDRGDPARWEWDRWAEDVADFCDALEIESPVLLGTSCGGGGALTCALDHPGAVAGGGLASGTAAAPAGGRWSPSPAASSPARPARRSPRRGASAASPSAPAGRPVPWRTSWPGWSGTPRWSGACAPGRWPRSTCGTGPFGGRGVSGEGREGALAAPRRFLATLG